MAGPPASTRCEASEGAVAALRNAYAETRRDGPWCACQGHRRDNADRDIGTDDGRPASIDGQRTGRLSSVSSHRPVTARCHPSGTGAGSATTCRTASAIGVGRQSSGKGRRVIKGLGASTTPTTSSAPAVDAKMALSGASASTRSKDDGRLAVNVPTRGRRIKRSRRRLGGRTPIDDPYGSGVGPGSGGTSYAGDVVAGRGRSILCSPCKGFNTSADKDGPSDKTAKRLERACKWKRRPISCKKRRPYGARVQSMFRSGCSRSFGR